MASLRASLVLAVALAGCALHDARPAFKSGVLIGHRGIVVPLPPPSLTSEPEQEVDIHGDLTEDAELVAGTTLHVRDTVGGGQAEVALAPGQREFTISGLFIDVDDNCLELWLEQPDGSESEQTYYSTQIAGDTELDVAEGCG